MEEITRLLAQPQTDSGRDDIRITQEELLLRILYKQKICSCIQRSNSSCTRTCLSSCTCNQKQALLDKKKMTLQSPRTRVALVNLYKGIDIIY